jgi:hypothetical protein
MEKRLLRLRQKLLDLLTLSDNYIKNPKFKKETVLIDKVEYEKKIYDGDKVTHCKRIDWVNAESPKRGNSARKRIRSLIKEINKITKEIRKITFEIDEEEKEYKRNKDTI